MLSSTEKQYYGLFPEVDTNRVGVPLGEGAQNLTSLYGEDQVIKAPLHRVRTGIRHFHSQLISRVCGSNPDKVRRELDRAHEYFPERFLTPTEVYVNKFRRAYVMLQPQIAIEPLSTDVYEQDKKEIEPMLEELIECGRKMQINERQFPDYMGWKFSQAMRFVLESNRGYGYMENVSVERDEKGVPVNLRLFDYGTFPMDNPLFRLPYYAQQINTARYGHKFS